jgi:hypothetical protein
MSNNGSNTSNNVDEKRLRQLYRSDEAAKALFDHLARRERNRNELPVDRLALNIATEGSTASRSDVVRVLKALEQAGCGKYVAGRKGHQSRFQWHVDMVAVGRYASGQAAVINEINPAAADEAEILDTRDAPTDSTNGSDELTHRFQLRPDLLVSIGLPINLTAVEAARLADFIRTLPFS